jgi:hypothetical protein
MAFKSKEYVRDGVRGAMYGPKPAGETPGTLPPSPDEGAPCTFGPLPTCVSGLATNVQADGALHLTPAWFLAAYSPAPTREPTYYRIVFDSGGPAEQDSGNIGWDDVYKISGNDPCNSVGAVICDIYAGNACGEDFCQTTLLVEDNDTVCPS